MPGSDFAKALIIMDMDSIRAIQDLVTKCAVADDKGKLKTINDIQLHEKTTILMKYIVTNHPSDILSSDIDEMKQYGIEFDRNNDDGNNALQIYCSECKGVLDKSVVQSLINGGCPINWREEKKDGEDDEDELGLSEDEMRLQRLEIILGLKLSSTNSRAEYTPLHIYCQLKESDLEGFKILVECGADVHLQSRENSPAIEYLLHASHHINQEFVTYLVNKCKVNFNRQLSNGKLLFNLFLSENAKINKEAVTALCDIAECDANSRDDENDTNSLISYVTNHQRKFDIEVVKCLVDLGANINEPDNDGKYPIQYALQVRYTPLDTLMKYARDIIECGAKLQHILADDPLNIEDHKLYILQQMKDGYEMYDGSWCRIETWSWTAKKKKQKLQSAIALDRFGATKLFIQIERQNLIEISQDMLIEQYQDFASVSAEHLDDEEDDEEERKEKEQDNGTHHDVVEEQPEKDKEP